MERAGIWRRLSATAIDVIVIVLPSMVLAGVLWNGLLRQGRPGERAATLIEGAAARRMACLLSAAGSFQRRHAREVLLRIAIRSADGVRADRWTLLLRYTTKQLGFLLSLIFALSGQPVFYWLGGTMNLIVLVGCLRALSEDRVTWHDIWCHTAVYVCGRATVDATVANPDQPLGAPPPT